MGVSLPVYVPESPPSGPARRRRVPLLLASLIVALLVLAWVAGLRPSRSVVATPNPSPPVPGNIHPLPLGSPIDGLGTKMLPVQVTPDKDLVDGQQVTVTGSGFTPSTSVGAVMCTGAARTEGVAACDLSMSLGGATTDREGAFTMTMTVRRYPSIGGGPVDCGTGNVDPDDYAALLTKEGPHPTTYNPASATCVVAVGELSNYDNSGGWPIAFTGETFLHGTTSTTGPTDPAGPATTVADGVAPSPPSSMPRLTPGPSTAPTTGPSSSGGLTPATNPGPVGTPID